MFELDKNGFGKFLSEQRKAKGYTQKELAEKLFVSDKAVSKWERSLSMPDISLLIPLAKILDVSVTELLEGRRLNPETPMDAGQVETLVKKALTLSEESPERRSARRRKNAVTFFCYTAFMILEILAGIWFINNFLSRTGRVLANDAALMSGLITACVLVGLSFAFGVYLWFFIKERLPLYYDDNEISTYCDGVFRLSLPGLSFNNRNWPHIVHTLRIWSVVTMVTIPPVCLLLALIPGAWLSFGLQMAVLLLDLAGLFVPPYILGNKYGNARAPKSENESESAESGIPHRQ